MSVKVKNSAGMVKIAKSMKGVGTVKQHDSSVSISMKNAGSSIPKLLKKAERSRISVESVDLHKPTLEDVFIHFTGKAIRDHEASAGDAFRQRVRMMHRR